VGDSGPPWRDREMPRRHLQLLRAPPGECEARCKTDDKQKAPVHTRIARAHRIAIRQSAWLSAVPDTRGHRHRDANARRCGICAAQPIALGVGAVPPPLRRRHSSLGISLVTRNPLLRARASSARRECAPMADPEPEPDSASSNGDGGWPIPGGNLRHPRGSGTGLWAERVPKAGHSRCGRRRSAIAGVELGVLWRVLSFTPTLSQLPAKDDAHAGPCVAHH
jgi:hypothetical protein